MACQQQAPPKHEKANVAPKPTPIQRPQTLPIGNPSPATTDSQQQTGKEDGSPEHESLPSLATPEWITTIITGIYALVSTFMWLSMRRSVKEMSKQSGLMARNLASLRQQSRILKDSIEIARRSADIAESSAKTYQNTERAWMTWTRFESGTIASNDDQRGIVFKMYWINTGRTPAINSSLVLQIKHTDNSQEIPNFDPSPDTATRQAPLIPGVEVYSAGAVDQQIIDNLRNGTCRLFLYGRCDYQITANMEQRSRTEGCLEVALNGFDSQGRYVFRYMAIGPQNSVT